MTETRSLQSGAVVAIDCHAHVLRRDAPLASGRHSAPKRDCSIEEY
jgi:predicted TIM-barrel fold metal-dependent hydrolase